VQKFQRRVHGIRRLHVRPDSRIGEAPRIELEHRYLERAGDTAQMMRDAIDSPRGWGGLLQRFAEAVGAARG